MKNKFKKKDLVATGDLDLAWTCGWRRIYAAEAEILGYEARSSGSAISIHKDGRYIAAVKPQSNPFKMRDLIEQAKAEKERLDKMFEQAPPTAKVRTLGPRRLPGRRNTLSVALLMAAAYGGGFYR